MFSNKLKNAKDVQCIFTSGTDCTEILIVQDGFKE